MDTMRIAILSGKGGTGKTLVAVNLAVTAGKATYVDCDVEEPNGRLFLKPGKLNTKIVTTRFPVFDETKCIGCRKCVSFCRFNALVYIKNKPFVFSEVCHACGGCALVCPCGAISENEKPIGVIECGTCGNIRVITGCMNLGEVSGVPIIKEALSCTREADELIVIDCPPGSGCSVMESVQRTDYCVLVAEPTAFGLHNLEMIYELVCLLQKPCGVVINKADGNYAPLDDFCIKHAIPVLCRIPYSEKLAKLCAKAKIVAMADSEAALLFQMLFANVMEKAGT